MQGNTGRLNPLGGKSIQGGCGKMKSRGGRGNGTCPAFVPAGENGLITLCVTPAPFTRVIFGFASDVRRQRHHPPLFSQGTGILPTRDQDLPLPQTRGDLQHRPGAGGIPTAIPDNQSRALAQTPLGLGQGQPGPLGFIRPDQQDLDQTPGILTLGQHTGRQYPAFIENQKIAGTQNSGQIPEHPLGRHPLIRFHQQQSGITPASRRILGDQIGRKLKIK